MSEHTRTTRRRARIAVALILGAIAASTGCRPTTAVTTSLTGDQPTATVTTAPTVAVLGDAVVVERGTPQRVRTN